MSVIIIGAGGHAKVVIELFRAAGMEVAGVLTNDAAVSHLLGAPRLGGDADLERLKAEGLHRAFVAIGDNRTRARLGKMACEMGFEAPNAISPAAVISPTARLGRGIAIMAGAVLNAETVVEDFAVINTRASVDHDGRIGLAAHIAPGCALAGCVSVGERSFLGAGVTVIPNRTIGADIQVGAGACVVSDLAEPGLYLGVPARRRAATS